MKIGICGGRVIGSGHSDQIQDILVEDGKIAAIDAPGMLETGRSGMKVIDASGKIVTPGLIDMHVHLREPGDEHKETIETGCSAAAAGGFTAVCPMPNTHPVNDSPRVTDFILEKAAEAGGVRVYPVAAISKGLLGKDLCEFGELKESGVLAFSDDGCPVADSRLMRTALEHAKDFGMPVISHCEELSLGPGGVMNEGAVAVRMGFAGIPNAVESIMVMRDIALCELTGAALHIAHVSTAESVRAIREAKAAGIPVTAETAPHYFTLTDEAVVSCTTHAKMNPPLRSPIDREAIRVGLADGTIDAIATDHAPHSPFEKDVDFNRAANGIIGLETSLPLCLKLVEDGILTLPDLIGKMSANPARILGLKSGIEIGLPADITIIDPDLSWTVDATKFRSLSRNTPFEGWHVKGRAVLTMVDGRIVFDEMEPGGER